MTLVGMGGLVNEKDLNKALDTCFSEFIGIGYDRMTNRDLDILLKENRGKEIREEIDQNILKFIVCLTLCGKWV